MSDAVFVQKGDKVRVGSPSMVDRYRLSARINHWITAVTMVLLVLSGLAMFHPSLFFLSGIFGSGQNTRAFHPWFGVVLAVSFAALFVQFRRGNGWTRADTDWLAHMGDLLRGREDKMPEAGKFNAGQKFVFWAMAFLIVVLFVTGLIIWEEYFGRMTAIDVQRAAVLAHAVAAIGAILVLILHVYAAIWVRGSFDAMIKGKVTAGWAWRHHRRWFRQLAGDNVEGPAE